MYLSDVEEGGETCFPQGTFLDKPAQRLTDPSPCGSVGVCIKPRKGDALLFHTATVEGKAAPMRFRDLELAPPTPTNSAPSNVSNRHHKQGNGWTLQASILDVPC